MLIIKCYGLEEDRVTYLSKISTDDLKKIYGSDDNEINRVDLSATFFCLSHSHKNLRTFAQSKDLKFDYLLN